MDEKTRVAFERLLRIARRDTHQASRAASFVLAWWNPESLGGFALTDICSVDAAIADDMVQLFSHLARLPAVAYPDEYRADIEAIIEQWRPDVWAHSRETG